MKIKVLKATAASGVHLEKGKVYDLSEFDAKFLIDRGKAEIIKQKVKKIIKTTE